VKLSKITEYVRNGKSIKNSSDGSGLPITRIETISDGTFNENKLGYGGVKDLDKIGDYWLQDGDILMSHINSPKHLGKAAIYTKNDLDIIHGMNLLGIRPIKSEVIPKYLNYYFLSKDFDSYIKSISNQSVNQASFAASKLKNLEIPLPSLSEQKTIVAKLDRAQRLIDIDKEMLAKYDELIQSVFLEMFGDPALNPKRWKTKPIKDLLVTKKIKRENPKKKNKVYDYISISDIDNDLKRIVGYTVIDKTDAPSRARQLLISNDVIVSTVRPNLNAVAIYRNGLSNPIASTGFCVLRPNLEVVNPRYLFQISQTNFFVSELSLIANGASYPAVTDNDILNLEIPVPPVDEQNTFEKIVEKISQEYQITKANKKKSEELFSSLVQGVFV
jgi:type I restriction enzyme S subunit